MDSVENVDYQIPNLRLVKLGLGVSKKHRQTTFDEPLDKIVLSVDGQDVVIDSDTERYKLIHCSYLIRKFKIGRAHV